jgi:plasmid maintenance system antidote protein VapI
LWHFANINLTKHLHYANVLAWSVYMRKVKQADIAEYIGISRPLLSQIMTNQRGITRNTAGKMAAKTGCKWHRIMVMDRAELWDRLVAAWRDRNSLAA